jgi:hypothetical protein
MSSEETNAGCYTLSMVFFFIVSLGLLLWSYKSYTFTSNVLENNILVEAQVVDLLSETRATSSYAQHALNKTAPTLEFYYKGDTIQLSSEQFSNVLDYAIGDKIGVYVNKKRPKDSVINTWSEKWGKATLLLFLGVIFLIISSVSIFFILVKRVQGK